MATYTHVDGDLQTLANILNNSGYFDQGGVTYTSESNFGYITCTKGDLMFKLGEALGEGLTSNAWQIKASGLVTTYTRSASGYNIYDYKPLDVYVCSGGISIICQCGRIAIGKTNNNETAVAFGDNPANRSLSDAERTAATMSAICAISESDSESYKYLINNTNKERYAWRHPQTYLIPVPTNGSPEKVSYTPSVMLLWLAQTRDVCHFSYNNKRYFSDGYFAIEDTAS